MKFNVEYQYQAYLKRMGLDESLMDLTRRVETKRAFFGAWGQFLNMMADDMPKVPPNEGMQHLQNMDIEVKAYWETQP